MLAFFSHIPTISPLAGYYASFFLPHTHYLSIAWVSCLLFLPHTHYLSIGWVSCLLFLSHTHYLSIAWVSCLLFLPHTHYLSPVRVLRLLFLPHTHYNYLVKKRSRAYARLLKIQINSMNESKLLCYSSHCLIVILCSYPDIVLIWVLLLLK